MNLKERASYERPFLISIKYMCITYNIKKSDGLLAIAFEIKLHYTELLILIIYCTIILRFLPH